MKKILCIGCQWRGANDGALFKAFSRLGHLITIVDEQINFPSGNSTFLAKVFTKLTSPVYRDSYNVEIVSEFKIFQPDLVLVYKGANVKPETLDEIKKGNVPIVCIYPDVSLFDHGPFIPRCVKYYDYIFTTKKFGLKDLHDKFQYDKVSFFPHAFDPDIHRRFDLKNIEMMQYFDCDASFIGNYSLKKDKILATMKEKLPELNLKIWGGHWGRNQYNAIHKCICHRRIHGDLYALAIQHSKINIAILSEQGGSASSGDQITARTFEIPACSGFMIHERTEEFLNYFEEGKTAACFGDAEELADKIDYYLRNSEERKRIAEAGFKYVWKNHSVDKRAKFILDTLEQNGIL